MMWFLYWYRLLLVKSAASNSQDKNFSSLCFTVLPRLVFLKNNVGKDESGSSNKKLATF